MSGLSKKNLLHFAKGFRGRAKSCHRIARERVMKALQYSYRDRKNKKREFRKLWITQLGAGLRQHDLNYSRFMHGCVISDISLNRKMLSELAIYEPYSFKALVNFVGGRLKQEEQERDEGRRMQEMREMKEMEVDRNMKKTTSTTARNRGKREILNVQDHIRQLKEAAVVSST